VTGRVMVLFVGIFLFLIPAVPSSAASTLSIRVAGSTLINGSGQVVQLRGVNRDGTDYACQQGWGIFDGPNDAASIDAMQRWGVNAVRVPLNEDCWLGINGINPDYSGANYRKAIEAYAKLINKKGMYVILALTSSAPGTAQADGEQPMPDQSHSPAFWKSVAKAFKNRPAVIFDLFGEPYPDDNQTTTEAWQCWENGGTCTDISYKVAGMQELVNTVRATGATNVVMLGGIGYANILNDWGTYEPTDPDNQLAASFHNYPSGECNNTTCWAANLTDINGAPLITGEFGGYLSTSHLGGYLKSYATWADDNGVSYLAWTWDTWGCTPTTNLALISNYNGAPCPGYGTVYRAHLRHDAGIT
jgi:endoglucanase